MVHLFGELYLIICMRANIVGMVQWANGVSEVERRGDDVAWSESEHV